MTSDKKDHSASAQFRDAYHLGKRLGEGAFGVVHICRKKGTDNKFAVKVIEIDDPAKARDAEREAMMLRRFNHRNVISVADNFRDKMFHYVVMPLFQAGDLVDVVQTHLANGKLQDSALSRLFAQMLLAIQHLHNLKIIHRDVKADNFLLDRFDIEDKDCRLALSDMGTAVQNSEDKLLSRQVGTKIYWSPEVVRKRYSFPSDIWAIGVIHYGIVNGSFPFRDEQQILEREPAIKAGENMSPNSAAFLRRLLDKDDKRRPNVAECLQFEWIKNKNTGEQFTLNANMSMQLEDLHVSKEVAKDEAYKRKRMLMDLMNGANAGKIGVIGRRHSDTVLISNDEALGNVFHLQDIVSGFETTSGAASKQKTHYWKWMEIYKLGDQLGPRAALQKNIISNDMQVASWSPERVKTMFEKYNVDTSHWAQGLGYTNIAKEIISGECSFTEIDKKLLRIVEVVLVRIVNKKDEMLVEAKIFRACGDDRDTGRLPGTKKKPHESVKIAADRVLSDYLRMDPRLFKVSNPTEVLKEEMDSPAYPGFKTLYVKHFVDARLMRVNGTSVSFSQNENGFMIQDHKGDSRQWLWMSPKNCDRYRVVTRGTKTTTADLSEFMKPVVDATWSAAMVKEKLESYKINTENYGAGVAASLQNLADELNNGQSGLMEDNYDIMRVVDVVLLRITDSTGNVLIENKTRNPDGKLLLRNRLPGMKRKPGESLWRTVRRCLDSQLSNISENVVFPVTYEHEEQLTESVSYPNLKCVYRKYFFNCAYDASQKAPTKRSSVTF